MIPGTGCDRGCFSVVAGTIWLQYGPSGCSRDYFRAASLDGLTKKNDGGGGGQDHGKYRHGLNDLKRHCQAWMAVTKAGGLGGRSTPPFANKMICI